MTPKRMTPPSVARMLGVNRNTVYAWCRRALEGRPSKLHDVKRNGLTGRITVGAAEVRQLKAYYL